MIKPSDEIFSPYHINQPYTYSGPFNHVMPIAQHYGFKVIKPIEDAPSSVDNLFEAKLAHLSHYIENQETYSSPALLCHTHKAKNKTSYINLDAHGVEDAFVETLLLKSAYEMLKREKHENLLIEINSFGSEESYTRFSSEVQKFSNKHRTKFDEETQARLAENPFYIYEIDQCENPDLDSSQCDILLHRPRPVANLSEPCRLHLKELLEHLEEAEIPYHLNPYLFPESGKHAETVYKIIDLDTSEVVAYGERFSTRAKKHLQVKADEIIHCAAITVQVSGGKTEKYQEVSAEDELSKYNVYFAHSGSIAKKNTLRVLEMLHDAGINVKHSVIKNTLREQLYHSEKYQFPITVILGVKEVQDGTIIVRNNQANRQKAIPLNRMCSYIKRYL